MHTALQIKRNILKRVGSSVRRHLSKKNKQIRGLWLPGVSSAAQADTVSSKYKQRSVSFVMNKEVSPLLWTKSCLLKINKELSPPVYLQVSPIVNLKASPPRCLLSVSLCLYERISYLILLTTDNNNNNIIIIII